VAVRGLHALRQQPYISSYVGALLIATKRSQPLLMCACSCLPLQPLCLQPCSCSHHATVLLPSVVCLWPCPCKHWAPVLRLRLHAVSPALAAPPPQPNPCRYPYPSCLSPAPAAFFFILLPLEYCAKMPNRSLSVGPISRHSHCVESVHPTMNQRL